MFCQTRYFIKAKEVDFYIDKVGLYSQVGKNFNLGKDGRK